MPQVPAATRIHLKFNTFGTTGVFDRMPASFAGLAFARDPDGYWVEIIKRGGYDAEATPYFFEKS